MSKNVVKVTSILAVLALVIGMAVPAVAATTTTNNNVQEILVNALQEERLAAATYQAIIDKFGEVQPFVNILKAEEQHIAAVENLMKVNGIAIPTDTTKATAPNTLQEAYEIGIKVEKEDIALYEELIPQLNDTMIKTVFTRLSNASERHLTAFEAYSKGETSPQLMNGRQGPKMEERGQGYGQKMWRENSKRQHSPMNPSPMRHKGRH